MSAPSSHSERSIEEIDFLLTSEYAGKQLSASELDDADLFGSVESAWLIQPGIAAAEEGIILGVDSDFPVSLPKVFLPQPDRWHLKIPHVSSNGNLCLVPETTTANMLDPVGATRELITRAIDEIRKGIDGSNKSDFLNEIETYWLSTRTEKSLPVWSLLSCEAPSRLVYVVRFKSFILVGDSTVECKKWMTNYSGRDRVNVERALFLWSENGIYPDRFPTTNQDIFDLIDAEAPGLLDKAFQTSGVKPSKLLVVIGMPTKNGTASLASSVGWVSHEGHINGFRTGKLPAAICRRRYERENCSKHYVQRISADWVHSRGGGQGYEVLRDKHVAIIGCGSIGADVAQLLANAGVGKLSLIDQDHLSWDNIGRHLLGASDVGKNKAQALCSHLRLQFPHLKIESHSSGWQGLEQASDRAVFSSDVVASLTGDWISDYALNKRIRVESGVPVVFGWTEPHGIAGHALRIGVRGGCLACGRYPTGEIVDRVTLWKESGIRALPACGGFFHPYGAIETAPIKSMIASLITETLTLPDPIYSESRVWVGDVEKLVNLGGEISPAWHDKFRGQAGIIGQMFKNKWGINPKCRLCEEN